MSDSLIIIPTYNEKENIEKIIRKILSLEKLFHILVIEDGSPDYTSTTKIFSATWKGIEAGPFSDSNEILRITFVF